MESQLLSVRDIRKSFGGVRAVDGVSLDVKNAQIVGLIGPNGSGKSTLFNVISGLYRPDGGTIRFGGSDISRLSSNRIYERGLVRSFQLPRLFQRMTVTDNMLVSARGQVGDAILNVYLKKRTWGAQSLALRRKAADVLSFVGLSEFGSSLPTSLSGGQLKLLELARSLMSDPKVLLLDEPTAGVYPDLAKKIFGHVRELREKRGLSFLVIEHRVDLLEVFADYIYVMDQGRILSEGRPEKVMKDLAVIEAYLGK